MLRWLDSYLRERSQAVTVKGYCSTFVPVPSGVPQGSHLGPLLFNIFVNDIVSVFQNSCFLMYADDSKIFRIVESLSDCDRLQNDLDRLINYCFDNFLYLNIKKCNVITFSRKREPIMYKYRLNNEIISRQSEVRNLGVHLDSKLTFGPHIGLITAKAYRMLGFVMRTGGELKQITTLILLYNCFVRSILEYASTVWNPQYNVYIDNIERIQNKFLRFLECKYPSFDSSNIKSLLQRRIVRDQLFIHKILNNIVDSSFLLNSIGFRCPRVNTRNTSLFHVPLSRTNYLSNTFVYRSCDSYNKNFQDVNVFNISLYKFKKLICSLEKRT